MTAPTVADLGLEANNGKGRVDGDLYIVATDRIRT
eukprot:CAMPEP_0119490782 /NCGR_PEP_ID=MMETSP1344-20130328/15847_1 /TAXON_ID=236787 /ORGANISM="Florenciella parvula, Strain CCMP2471" /LENGTH=34 /DNA_ID= /DNA_START= /DNA_END= /DNA_ORIENTATION=